MTMDYTIIKYPRPQGHHRKAAGLLRGGAG